MALRAARERLPTQAALSGSLSKPPTSGGGFVSAQRPKASEREEQRRRRPRGQPREVLNARRHRSGKNLGSVMTALPVPQSAQRPKASEREEPASTPRSPSAAGGAQRPKASEREELAQLHPPLPPQPVLNARRHRSGKNSNPPAARQPLALVLNARRHRSEKNAHTGHRDHSVRRITITCFGAWRSERSDVSLRVRVGRYGASCRWGREGKCARVRIQSLMADTSFGLRREGPARAILWAPWRTRSQMASATVGSARKSCHLSCFN